MLGDKTVENRSVQEKINECKELIIQNMEKTLQNKMVYMFLKDRKKESDVKTYSVNSKDGIIKIEFTDHEKAKNFYYEANFTDKILIRPFNIYFNLQLTDNEMKKYYLEGITEENQKALFQAAIKIGVCKIYTSYGAGSRAKLKPTGLLSFIRKEPIEPNAFKRLTEQLSSLGIKIFQYVHEKGLKVSLNLIDFIPDSRYDEDEIDIQQQAEDTAKMIVGKHAGNPPIQHYSVISKKKEVLIKKTEQKINKVKTSALFEFDNVEDTYKIYEKVRSGIINDPVGKVKLFFHNQENNSFISLITQGLCKPEGLSEKQFEEKLIEVFRKINPSVLQVNIFPVHYNSTYFGRVYLRNQEDGKMFLVDYAHHRSKMYEFYRDKNNMIFNISIDTKTLRKIKNAERKAKETEERIKKQSEASKRDRPAGQPRINPVPQFPGAPFNSGVIMPNMPNVPIGMHMPPQHMPMNPSMAPGLGNKPPMPSGVPGVPGGVPGIGSMGAPPSQMSIKDKVNGLLRDKERMLSMTENSAKRILSDCLKALAQDIGAANGAQAVKFTNEILKENSVHQTYRFLENTESLKEEIRRLRQAN